MSNNEALISGKTGGFNNQKSSYAKKVERSNQGDSNLPNKNTKRYSNQTRSGFEEFIISPIPNEDGKIVEAELSNQASEFLKSNKNRIQISNQINDVLEINLIPDEEINYKNIELLKKYMSQFGQIRSMYSIDTRVKYKKRRLISNAIKKARFLGLISYPDQIV